MLAPFDRFSTRISWVACQLSDPPDLGNFVQAFLPHIEWDWRNLVYNFLWGKRFGLSKISAVSDAFAHIQILFISSGKDNAIRRSCWTSVYSRPQIAVNNGLEHLQERCDTCRMLILKYVPHILRSLSTLTCHLNCQDEPTGTPSTAP